MILNILTYGDPILKTKCDDWDLNEDVSQLAKDMIETMQASKGIGLAAPQIGVNKNLIVIDDDGVVSTFVNLKITKYDESSFYSVVEGCLSVPKIEYKVIRPGTIEVEYYDENWNFHTVTFDSWKARIIQHEFDHINGILFVERLGRDDRRMVAFDLLMFNKKKK